MSDLLTKLPLVRGYIKRNVDLSKQTWFRSGGTAEILYKPINLDELIYFLKNLNKNIPVCIIGATSNLLIRDGGLSGVTVKLGNDFNNIKIKENKLLVGTATPCMKVAKKLALKGISGMEFFIGIPGTIGGAIKMNAGAYDGQTSDFLRTLKAVDRKGKIHSIVVNKEDMTYRKSNFPDDWIFVSAEFEGTILNQEKVTEKIKKFSNDREKTQPIRQATGGSTFKNTKNKKAWRLIKDAGCYGMSVGSARLSDKHLNFIINNGSATSADIELLGEKIKEKVKNHSGYELDWEINIIGNKNIYEDIINDK